MPRLIGEQVAEFVYNEQKKRHKDKLRNYGDKSIEKIKEQFAREMGYLKIPFRKYLQILRAEIAKEDEE